ncbi:hypothetical protein Sango_2534600 [Sesamum angolense]|uniref:GAG-pre-integrase domain-containing protein n=1 Tax=Sesamum angolense TaxID=2727404 RepID=A0AAE1W4I4_9LAMI|nr:hypothetical protein Sango_2534600 [Sesamum angolense]
MHAGNFEKRKEGNNFRKKGVVDKRSLKCEHCDKSGHDKSTCFKLHGVPDWYKELGDKKRKSNAGHRAYAIQEGTELKEVNHTGESAGMNFTFSGVEYLNKDAWIIDSGATSHMCSDSKAFHTLNVSASVLSIFLPDGSTKQVTQSGFVNLFGKIKLVDTLYVSSFRSNLIFVHKTCATSNIRFTFLSSHCILQDHLTKTVVAVAKQSRHLYILDKDSFNPSFINQFLSSHFSFVSQVVGSDLSLWHQKLGHPSHKVLAHVPGLKSKDKTNEIFTICPLAKQHRLSFPRSVSSTLKPFELIHIDIWGLIIKPQCQTVIIFLPLSMITAVLLGHT